MTRSVLPGIGRGEGGDREGGQTYRLLESRLLRKLGVAWVDPLDGVIGRQRWCQGHRGEDTEDDNHNDGKQCRLEGYAGNEKPHLREACASWRGSCVCGPAKAVCCVI